MQLLMITKMCIRYKKFAIYSFLFKIFGIFLRNIPQLLGLESEGIMEELKNEIKKVIISSLELEDIKPEDIVDSEPIFGEGLGLDSIDALELGVALKRKFGIKFSSDNAENRKHFASVNALAEYINSTKNEEK